MRYLLSKDSVSYSTVTKMMADSLLIAFLSCVLSFPSTGSAIPKAVPPPPPPGMGLHGLPFGTRERKRDILDSSVHIHVCVACVFGT